MSDRPLPLDGDAARSATALAAVALCALVVGQAALAGIVTAGHQKPRTVDRVPASPEATAWMDAPSREVKLSEQQMALPRGGGSVDTLTVRTLTNETHVAIRLSWTDPTADTNASEPEAYSDAAAVMLRGGSQPPITMGAAGEPVDIWYWRASWQFSRADPGGDMYTYPHPDDETKPARAAGNPLSKAEYDRYAQNYYARGYGSLSHAPSQTVAANGERTEDGWSVVFVRERVPEGRYDAAFNESEQMYLAFAVWNGSADEVNGQKSLTLRFTTLDTRNGELSAAERGDGSGSTDDGPDGHDGGGGTQLRTATDWVAMLVATTLSVWIVTYWRLRS